MILTLEPVQVATGFDEEGVLVFDVERRLVAVLVRLSGQNDIAPRQWFLEAGFGTLGEAGHPIFADIDAALEWMKGRLAQP